VITGGCADVRCVRVSAIGVGRGAVSASSRHRAPEHRAWQRHHAESTSLRRQTRRLWTGSQDHDRRRSACWPCRISRVHGSVLSALYALTPPANLWAGLRPPNPRTAHMVGEVSQSRTLAWVRTYSTTLFTRPPAYHLSLSHLLTSYGPHSVRVHHSTTRRYCPLFHSDS